MKSPLFLLTLTRLRLLFREPGVMFWAFGFPILLTIALGIAFRSRPPEPVPIAIARIGDFEALSRALSTVTDLRVRVLDEAEATLARRSGKVALIVIPGTPVTYELDPMRPDARLGRALVNDAIERAAGRADVVGATDRVVTEPGARYVDFLVPGLIGSNVMQSSMWAIGYALVDMRTRKLLKRLLATPMKRRDLLLSFILMRLVFLVVELPLLVLIPHLLFDVPVRGSLLGIVAICVAGSMAFAGLGLLIASRAQNTQTVGGLMNAVMMPMFLLSGVFFSSENFPDVMQPVIRALPLTVINDGLRALMNDGAGLAQVVPGTLGLLLMSVVTLGVALRIFRWN